MSKFMFTLKMIGPFNLLSYVIPLIPTSGLLLQIENVQSAHWLKEEWERKREIKASPNVHRRGSEAIFFLKPQVRSNLNFCMRNM